MKIRILLADDHTLIREGFKSMLGGKRDLEVIGEADNGPDVVKAVAELRPDVVLLDLNMPGLSGVEVMERLRTSRGTTRFLILTMHDEREYVMKSLKAGADGYVLKSIEGAELEKAIRTVHNGGKYFSMHITSILAETIARPVQEIPEITAREKEVLGLVADGLSTKQIADKLNISIRTVESHRVNMLKKLSVNNSAELIRKAMELGMIG